MDGRLCLSLIALIGGLLPSSLFVTSAASIDPSLASFTGYEPSKIPVKDGQPLFVNISILVEDFGRLEDSEMDFSCTMYLRQYWSDYRLTHNSSAPIIIKGEESPVWIPDLFVLKEKVSYVHKLLFLNKLIWIFQDGTVLTSARISIKVSCALDLREYPMDTQSCSIRFMSYSYSTQHIVLKLPRENVEISDGIFIPSFELSRINTSEETITYALGDFSLCSLTFVFSRQLSSFLLVVYAPSLALVIIAWLSFWIDINAAPARVSLTVMLVLTINTMTAGVQNTIPSVTYAKAIDIWLGVCMVFVFSALLEYAVINYVMVVKSDEQTALQRISKSMMNGMLTHENVWSIRFRPQANPRLKSHTLDEIAQYIKATNIDKSFRLGYPIMFGIFCLIYWTYYIVRQTAEHDDPGHRH